MNNEKLENLLNLALNATPEEREKSLELNVGYDTVINICICFFISMFPYRKYITIFHF